MITFPNIGHFYRGRKSGKRFIVALLGLQVCYLLFSISVFEESRTILAKELVYRRDPLQESQRYRSWEDLPHSERRVAIGCALTFRRNVLDLAKDRVFSPKHTPAEVLGLRFPFFKTFLTSFCRTASEGFEYGFFIAYDFDDRFFSNALGKWKFQVAFNQTMSDKCSDKSNYFVRFVECAHQKRPAWAQNEAMMAAYLSNMAYFFRLNDDTNLTTSDWTKKFIDKLLSYEPPNIGVVGPDQVGGNKGILTYDFVHRTHIDIFGYYYPRTFTDWYADNWVSFVYHPNRTTKMSSVQLVHTKAARRYSEHTSLYSKIGEQVGRDRLVLDRYLRWKTTSPNYVMSTTYTRMIAMSLYSTDLKYTMGVLRNAQIMPIYFPGWRLRVYVQPDLFTAEKNTSIVGPAFISFLERLGVQIRHVSLQWKNLPPKMYHYAIMDDSSVDYFIARSPDQRLSDRDAKAVSDWMESDKPFHVVHDDPLHPKTGIIHDLFGGKGKELRTLLQAPMGELIRRANLPQICNASCVGNFLNECIYPKVKQHVLCHDDVTGELSDCERFPVKRDGKRFVGETFEAFENHFETMNSFTFSTDGSLFSNMEGAGIPMVYANRSLQ